MDGGEYENPEIDDTRADEPEPENLQRPKRVGRKLSPAHLKKMQEGRLRWLEDQRHKKETLAQQKIVAILEEAEAEPEEPEEESEEEEEYVPPPKIVRRNQKKKKKKKKSVVNNYFYEDDESSEEEEGILGSLLDVAGSLLAGE